MLKSLSGFFFYLLGATFIVAYILYKKAMSPELMLWWLQVADVPLALAALTYAGTSLYKSIVGDHRSLFGCVLIGVPVLLLFGVVVVLNFWNLLVVTSS